ncbi:unnamed protein product [Cuscuta epithymum]|uniref:Uncharacterized protein n=1 Tax=Cuscuta epithymum TaxID=186058 RepID=A0AAV0DWS5_9ASTE|nr:unnamed protein product [Cuscuta epithymum]
MQKMEPPNNNGDIMWKKRRHLLSIMKQKWEMEPTNGGWEPPKGHILSLQTKWDSQNKMSRDIWQIIVWTTIHYFTNVQHYNSNGVFTIYALFNFYHVIIVPLWKTPI